MHDHSGHHHHDHGHDHDHHHDHDHDHHHHHDEPREPFDWSGFFQRNRNLWLVLLGLVLLWRTFYTVRETEFVLVTRLGRPVATVTEAGLKAKCGSE